MCRRFSNLHLRETNMWVLNLKGLVRTLCVLKKTLKFHSLFAFVLYRDFLNQKKILNFEFYQKVETYYFKSFLLGFSVQYLLLDFINATSSSV